MEYPNKFLLISITLFFLFSSLSAEQISKYKKNEPERGHIIKIVPFQKWKKKNYCGPAAMAMVLSYWKSEKQYQRKIAKGMYGFEEEIAYNSEMVFYPRTIGMRSYSFNGDIEKLKEIIEKDIPLIVLHKPVKQINKGHYRVVIGFDEDSQQIIFHDPLVYCIIGLYYWGRARIFSLFPYNYNTFPQLATDRNDDFWGQNHNSY